MQEIYCKYRLKLGDSLDTLLLFGFYSCDCVKMIAIN